MTVLELIKILRTLPETLDVVVPGGFDGDGYDYACDPRIVEIWDRDGSNGSGRYGDFDELDDNLRSNDALSPFKAVLIHWEERPRK